MTQTWIYALGSVAAVGLVSLAGVLTLSLGERLVRRSIFLLVALSAGALFGDSLIHLIPEAFRNASDPAPVSLLILSGIIVFFVLEKFLLWGHSHQVESCPDCERHEVKPVGPANLVSDGLHNFVDGLVIGASYLISLPVGLATTLAVILHEIPQEIGDFGILLHAGYTKGQAIIFNLLSATLALFGTILVLLVGESSLAISSVLLPLAAGGFLYIAGTDLVPELHKTVEFKKSFIQFLSFLLGIVLMYLLLFLE